MALRLIAGPLPVVDDTGVPIGLIGIGCWYPGVGLIATGWHIVTLDGVGQYIGYNLGSDSPNEWGWWPTKRRMVAIQGDNLEYQWEPFALLRQSTGPEVIRGPASGNFQPYVKLEDRLVYNNFWSMSNYKDGVHTVESGPCPFIAGKASAGRTETEIFVSEGGSGRATWYDSVAKTFSSVMYFGRGVSRAFYVPEYGVIVTTSSEYVESVNTSCATLRIWSLEVHPTILTDVELWQGIPKSGQIVTYRVRATGAQNDPAENELIDWSMTGAGTLLNVQSTTDANGYATTRVQYLLGENGETVLTASLKC